MASKRHADALEKARTDLNEVAAHLARHGEQNLATAVLRAAIDVAQRARAEDYDLGALVPGSDDLYRAAAEKRGWQYSCSEVDPADPNGPRAMYLINHRQEVSGRYSSWRELCRVMGITPRRQNAEATHA